LPNSTGEAAVAKLNVLGLNAAIEDTGPLPSGGESLSTEIVSANVPNPLDVHLLSASTDLVKTIRLIHVLRVLS
jgi:hypothetical protein